MINRLKLLFGMTLYKTLNSGFIHYLEYDPKSRELLVQFCHSAYVYKDVPPKIFFRVVDGKSFNKELRNKFKFTRIV